MMDKIRLTEILEAYAVETPDGNDQQILSAWTKRYPEFASEILDFAAARAVVKHVVEPETDYLEENEAREKGLAYVREFFGQVSPSKTVIDSLAGLAKQKGFDKAKFSAVIGISVSLLMYLEKKRLEFVTIPSAIVSRIAQVLEVTETEIAAYLDQRPTVSGASFKSETRPGEAVQKSFAEAVREDQMLSEEQKKALLRL